MALTPEDKKEKARWYNIKRLYGITQEQYEQILEEQDGRCGICKRHHTEFAKSLAVDHDHHDQTIRGLLCLWCNQRLLGRHTSSVLFRNAADYLDRPRRGWIVPAKKKPKRRKRKLKT